MLAPWASFSVGQIDFNRPAKPTDNCFFETFNGSHRNECLTLDWFEATEEAKERTDASRVDYNESLPHQVLDERTPIEFVVWTERLDVSMSSESAEN